MHKSDTDINTDRVFSGMSADSLKWQISEKYEELTTIIKKLHNEKCLIVTDSFTTLVDLEEKKHLLILNAVKLYSYEISKVPYIHRGNYWWNNHITFIDRLDDLSLSNLTTILGWLKYRHDDVYNVFSNSEIRLSGCFSKKTFIRKLTTAIQDATLVELEKRSNNKGEV